MVQLVFIFQLGKEGNLSFILSLVSIKFFESKLNMNNKISHRKFLILNYQYQFNIRNIKRKISNIATSKTFEIFNAK